MHIDGTMLRSLLTVVIAIELTLGAVRRIKPARGRHQHPTRQTPSPQLPKTTLLKSASNRPSAGESDIHIGCKEIRSKRYISDGFCTSLKPITEVVCTGYCLPIRQLPWYAEYIKVWARNKSYEWRCVDDIRRRRRVRLGCQDGSTRTYRVKVVKSCKCKKYHKRHNESRLRNKRHRSRKSDDESDEE